ncbi:hypothetical protein OCUBac02_54450 (plasmid) [Bosea sp. ANAM02]|nr:hypothetical protein OCUBac02_54450 [Bosea sp. ANAM02]
MPGPERSGSAPMAGRPEALEAERLERRELLVLQEAGQDQQASLAAVPGRAAAVATQERPSAQRLGQSSMPAS